MNTSQAGPIDALQLLLAKSAALLTLLAMLTGFLVASAMTGQIAADAHAMLAAHVNALAGAAWLGVLGWSLPRVQFGPAGLQRLTWATVVPAYANWLLTLVKSFLHVAGVAMTDNPSNNLMFALLGGLVVVPAVAAAGAWTWGLFRAGQ